MHYLSETNGFGKVVDFCATKDAFTKENFGFIQSALNMKMGLRLMKLCDFQQTIPPS